MNNVIIKDEEIIGYVEDVVTYIKDELIKQIKNIKVFNDEIDDTENLESNYTMWLEFLDKIHYDFIDGIIGHQTLIKIQYNPMGCYDYKIIEEIEG